MNFYSYIQNRWNAEGGYKHVLKIAVPLILSTGAWSIQLFVDRMFLTWSSPEEVAAAMPAGMLSFTIMSLFIGTATYVSTFVAQYYGANRKDRVGPSMWQGMYIAIFAAAVNFALIPVAEDIFVFTGHAPELIRYEIEYFRILCLGAFPIIISSAISGFYSGLGKTMPVMWVRIFATICNIILNYILIFGHFGAPRLGIKGAGIATVLSALISMIVYLFMVFSPEKNRIYKTLSGWRPDAVLFSRILKYGLPSGIQFCLEMAGFTVFIFLIGKLGTIKLAASVIALNINTLSFMPMIGAGIAVSVMVGQYLGQNKTEYAEYSTYSGFHITVVYMLIIAFAYVAVPQIFLDPFAAQADPETFPKIREIAIILLRFVAIYSVFDTMSIIFASAIKGAGDTRFVMIMIIAVNALILIIPTYIAIIQMGKGIYSAWVFATSYVSILGFIFYARFRSGRWKSMRVIEGA